MMKDCWAEKPADRPNFTALVQRLDHVIESNMAAMVSTNMTIRYYLLYFFTSPCPYPINSQDVFEAPAQTVKQNGR